ncbi:hypothetical protein EZV62_027247 [Acer yangbiense]|uniref:C-JID domain-containing protein n=1 Tax=Acer yangbiense TaxID=1000413 RepID=A0A5C7GTK1_9ROSI|nr:hypothetical protein EZV62_027247 [Acer yangbiense]
MLNLRFLKFYSSDNEMNSKHFDKLKYINLSHSKLTEIPDIPVAPSLESLILEGCNNLLEIPSSIGYLDKLVTLNLRDCKSLESLPNYIHLESLKILILSGCSNLNKFPGMLGNIQELYLGGTIIEELPSSIEYLSCLVILDLENCSRLTCLPNGICKLICLEELNLTGCSKLGRLPDDLGNLKALKKLKVSGTGVREVPSSIACLINSGTLSFERGQGQELMGLQLPSLLGLYNLTNLVLSDCNIKELPESLGSLFSVKMLSLCRNNFESIPASIINLSKLILLNISYCERLKSLPILPRDLKLVAHNCTSLEAFSDCSRIYALRYLVDHAVQKIQHIPSELYTELDEESDDEMPNVFICYPGNKLPEWFTFRSTGSFVIVRHLPQGWFSDNLVGLAICAVVAFQHHYDDDGRGLVLVCECEFISEDGCRHVARGYFVENFGEDYYTNEFSVKFYVEDYYSEHMHSCEVKKCGVRLIYRHEFGNSILNTSSDEDYFCKYLEEINGNFVADMHMEEEIPHGRSKLSASFKNRMQIKDELMQSSEMRLLESVSGGDIRIQALRTPDHQKRDCVGGMGEQRLVELEDTVQALAEQVSSSVLE